MGESARAGSALACVQVTLLGSTCRPLPPVDAMAAIVRAHAAVASAPASGGSGGSGSGRSGGYLEGEAAGARGSATHDDRAVSDRYWAILAAAMDSGKAPLLLVLDDADSCVQVREGNGRV